VQLWMPLSGKYLQLSYGFSGVPQVQDGSMFVEPQVRELLLWLCHIGIERKLLPTGSLLWSTAR
jgi:hypothetical protein